MIEGGEARVSLTDEAIQKLKEMILSGELSAGDRLPKEQDLADRLGLSRTSLREAVRALTFIGVLRTRRGDGTYVTTLEPELLLGSTGLIMDLLGRGTLVELMEVRRLLEPGVTALAAARMTSEDLERLGEYLQELDHAESVEGLVDADDAFHAIIAEAAGNTLLTSLLRNLSGRTLRARIWRGLVDSEAMERTKLGHHAIYRAIVARDPDHASAAAAMHVSETEYWFRKTLSDGEQDEEAEAVRVAGT